MFEFALSLFLTASLAHGTTPIAAPSTMHSITATSGSTPGGHGEKESKHGSKSKHGSESKHGSKSKHGSESKHGSKSKHGWKPDGHHGNRPVPGPVPLVLLGLGICGVGGARLASRRRRKKTPE